MHDSTQRMKIFVDRMTKEKADFIIQLGDFTPRLDCKDFINAWNQFKGKRFHVLGNHDMDECSKEEMMQFLSMKNNFYSFDVGSFHFVVLDPNFYKKDAEYISYNKGNHLNQGPYRGYVPDDQLEWLQQDLQKTDKPTLVFSHQSFERPLACKNQQDVLGVFEKANQSTGFKKVVACFSGHDHTDYLKEINGIHYIQINSMSYYWVGSEYECATRFSAEINEKFPHLKHVLPYRDPLFALVELDVNGVMTIKGEKSECVPPGPTELGIPPNWHNVPIVPVISDRTIRF